MPEVLKTPDDALAPEVRLAVLSVKERVARCRPLEGGEDVTLRAAVDGIFPGAIVTVRARKSWRYGGFPYLSGEILEHRVDIPALRLVPLGMEALGLWDPKDEYWGEEGEPLDDWAKAVIARGPRPELEMEQVLPGETSEGDEDPILEAVERNRSGDAAGARKVLMRLLEQDLRCLDAHAHLGNFAFDRSPQEALGHYGIGVSIGERSLGPDFDGVLSWGFVDNRPFLRCLNGYGLCLWRLGRLPEAERVFTRILWMNPGDNQGIRFVLPEVRAGRPWRAKEGG